MPWFRYKAMAASGELVQGEIQSGNHSSAIEQLQGMGYVPIRAEELIGKRHAPGQSGRRLFSGRRKLQLSRFTRDLATLLRSGVSLEQALEMLVDLAEEGEEQVIIEKLLQDIRGGSSLTEAAEAQPAVFNHFFVNMIRAGEAGGALQDVLNSLSALYEQYDELRRSVLSALIYPGVLLFVTLASLTILMVVVVPQFKTLFEDMGEELPMMTQVVIASGDFFQAWWWAMLLGLVAIVAILRQQLRQADARRQWDQWLLKLPLAGGLVVRFQVAVFSRTLATLLTSGVTLINALNIVKGTLTNQVLAERLAEASGRVREGDRLAEALARVGGFPKLSIHLIRVGEETGELGSTLFQLADIYDREVRESIHRMLSLLEPVLIIGLGLLIGGIIMSILVAILGLNELAL